MDSILNSKIDKQTIYEIYRACRLCGAGAGYKMPIIQNVVDLDANGIELKQKIRDCVQIEVNADDKMPPLICELCVDKVNDFYEFMEMCQQTNQRTRARLGLPPQSSGKVRHANYDSGDCILGVTEPVYTNTDSDEPLSSRRPEPKVKIKVEKLEITREPGTRLTKDSRSRLENSRESRFRPDNSKEAKPRSRPENNRESRLRLGSGRASSESRTPSPRVTRHRRPPTPPRPSRHSRTVLDENMALSNLKQQARKSSSKAASPPPPKSILKKDKNSKTEEQSKLKRTRESAKPDVPQKRVKLAVPPSPKPRAPRRPSPPAGHACAVCRRTHATPQALQSHMRSHGVGYTQPRLSCNACEDWFPSAEEASSHHRSHRMKHRPYRCRRCDTRFKLQQGYDDHITNNECVPWNEVPDVKCPECWREYPTQNLLDQHKCGGPDSRPGGKCKKCKRAYVLLKNLKKHEETCTARRKSADGVVLDPAVRAQLRGARVRLARCDALLARPAAAVAAAANYFDLDPRCTYPYRRPALASDLMVSIKAELDEFDEPPDFVHWDSEDSGDESRTVDSLSTLSLKTIFSKKMLGKVPRKRRRVKTEKNAFESILNASEFESDISKDIDNIIDKLGNDDDNESVNSESLLCNDSVAGSHGGGFTHNDVSFNDNSDSQSLLTGAGSEINTDDRIGNSFDTLKLDKDCASTDCDSDAEDSLKENDRKSREPRLSSGDKANDGTDIVDNVSRTEQSNNHLDTASTNSDVDNEERSSTVIHDENSHNLRIDSQMNGDVEDSSSNKDCVNHVNENVRETNENVSDNNHDVNESGSDEISLENHGKSVENHEVSDGKDEQTLRKQQENEAMCNDIENKINDIIALRKSENSSWDNTNNENNDRLSANDDVNENDRFVKDSGVSENNDIGNGNDILEELLPKSPCSVAENNDSLIKGNESFTRNNDVDKEKITLEDLLPKDTETKSMDLDSISEDEFDFDA